MDNIEMGRYPTQFYFFAAAIIAFHITSVVILHSEYGIIRIDVILENWNANNSRNLKDYIDPKLNSVPESFCNQKTFLLIMVYSSPDHYELREAIRETWAKKEILKKVNIELYFILGRTKNGSIHQHIDKERTVYNDIVQEDFIDSYNNLTLKAVNMLKVFNSCQNYTYLLKVDEDVLINVYKLVKLLLRRRSSYNLLTGRLIQKERVVRHHRARWYSPHYMYNEKYYPDFLGGPAYLMSRDVAEKLYKSAMELPLFHLEDVFITGICARHAGIKPMKNHLFVDYNVPPHKFSKMCSIHGVDPKFLRKLNCSFDPLSCPKITKHTVNNLKLKKFNKAF